MTISSLFSKQTYASIIDGDECRREGHVVELVSPTTSRPWKDLHAADPELVNRAIESAYQASRPWRFIPAPTRARLLRQVARLMEEHKDALALVMTMEMGKTLKEGRAEVEYAAGYFEWFAGEAERIYGSTIPSSSPTKRLMLIKEPVGVCALITPWNFPLAMPARKLAAALAAGCAVVIKPSPLTPISAILLGHLCLHAGVPPGVVNVVYGEDEVIGPILTGSPLIRKLSFTGSVAVGKKLYAECADTLKKITLELGGHAPLIVCNDASLERAVDGALSGKLRNCGQACISPNRLLVQSDIYPKFVKAFSEKLLNLRVGDPLDPSTEVSNVLHTASREKVERHVRDAVSKGAILHSAGEESYYPKILENVTPLMDVFREETFGPLASITRFETFSEAVELANNTDYGLASYIFSDSLPIAHGIAEALEFGIVGVNDALPSTPQASFGGIKSSGFGREGGPSGITEYLVEKYVSMAF
jgi:succinate-semialdehyde dehydrogenase/glutarate-semialdehyde dehydrogenase